MAWKFRIKFKGEEFCDEDDFYSSKEDAEDSMEYMIPHIVVNYEDVVSGEMMPDDVLSHETYSAEVFESS